MPALCGRCLPVPSVRQCHLKELHSLAGQRPPRSLIFQRRQHLQTRRYDLRKPLHLHEGKSRLASATKVPGQVQTDKKLYFRVTTCLATRPRELLVFDPARIACRLNRRCAERRLSTRAKLAKLARQSPRNGG